MAGMLLEAILHAIWQLDNYTCDVFVRLKKCSFL
jgi:hypothetical protein